MYICMWVRLNWRVKNGRDPTYIIKLNYWIRVSELVKGSKTLKKINANAWQFVRKAISWDSPTRHCTNECKILFITLCVYFRSCYFFCTIAIFDEDYFSCSYSIFEYFVQRWVYVKNRSWYNVLYWRVKEEDLLYIGDVLLITTCQN